MSIDTIISAFGQAAKAKLSNPVVAGDPEDQLRAPLERLIVDVAELCGLSRSSVIAVGESRIGDLKTRPDYAITVANAQVGYVEVKAPGKGADPRRYKGHDKAQWERLQCLPNIIYTDGNDFSLWRDGQLATEIVRLDGDVYSSGAKLKGSEKLVGLLDTFFRWEPMPPRDARQLAEVSARLCRFLREEVVEQLANHSPALTNLAVGWRKMLFPEASDAQFADGYALAVTFGLLVARAREIPLSGGLTDAARHLGATTSLIGTALNILTAEIESDLTLKTSVATLTRVLGVVQWQAISRGDSETWLYFYEDFLAVYDNDLRKKTGSYYTPPEVVESMVRLVDEVLRSSDRFGRPRGLADSGVTVADPAVGTGTFFLGVLRRIAATVTDFNGPGAVAAELNEALSRVIAFEMQLGPFAVAQLRVFAEIVELTKHAPKVPLRMFVTDTLGNPYTKEEWLPNTYAPIAESRHDANEIKKHTPVTVVIGNPPYKEKAKGMGGWVEQGGQTTAILNDWIPPANWGISAHTKHLRNLYIYFWRWATWKVFDHLKSDDTGIVCFITVAGFLNGPGFQRMRDYLRRKANEVWVIDCSPEGHQPDVVNRIFQGVQQPVCIVLVSRHKSDSTAPGVVRYRSLPVGNRQLKFQELAGIELDDPDWTECPSDWRAPFLPLSAGEWSTFPAIDDYFNYDGSGVMPGRTWVIAPDAESLRRRWETLTSAPDTQKEDLFHPHLAGGALGDRHSNRTVGQGLAGHEARGVPVARDFGPCVRPMRYAFRSLDRQWIIPDSRLINRPNPRLWASHSSRQVYLTAPSDRSPTTGPALTFSAVVPDLHHYSGRGGRVFPLWQTSDRRVSNVRLSILNFLASSYGVAVLPEDVMSYIAAVAASPAFTQRFRPSLVQPGLRIPFTADRNLFERSVELGRRIIWLQTFGEAYSDSTSGRPKGSPRLPKGRAPFIPADGSIPNDSGMMPDTMEYDRGLQRLRIGTGFVERVPPSAWDYEVSGKHVLRQWFSYRKANRERPIMGDRRPPSKLGDIKPDHWLAEYTSDLIDLINVLAMLSDLEPSQADLLERVCAGPLISRLQLQEACVLEDLPARKARAGRHSDQQQPIDGLA